MVKELVGRRRMGMVGASVVLLLFICEAFTAGEKVDSRLV